MRPIWWVAVRLLASVLHSDLCLQHRPPRSCRWERPWGLQLWVTAHRSTCTSALRTESTTSPALGS